MVLHQPLESKRQLSSSSACSPNDSCPALTLPPQNPLHQRPTPNKRNFFFASAFYRFTPFFNFLFYKEKEEEKNTKTETKEKKKNKRKRLETGFVNHHLLLLLHLLPCWSRVSAGVSKCIRNNIYEWRFDIPFLRNSFFTPRQARRARSLARAPASAYYARGGSNRTL